MPDLLADVLDAAHRHADRTALISGLGKRRSYAWLRENVLATADGLRARGLAPGDRVLFAVPPSPGSLVLALATVSAGATLAFADPRAGDTVLRARIDALAPRWAIAASPVYALAGGPWRAVDDATHVRVGPWLPGVPPAAIPWRRLAREGRFPRADREHGNHAGTGCEKSAHDHDAPALIIPTSGTTQAPRLVVHSRASLGAGLAAFAARQGFAPGDILHTDQLMIGLPALVGGATWSVPLPGARPGRLAQVLRRRRATHTFCVPADVDAVLGGGPLPATLRGVVLGAAPVLPGPLQRLRDALPDAELLAVYGMTECAPAIVATAEEKIAHTASGADGDLLGTPLPGVAVRTTDDGELVLRAPQQALRYLGGETLTEIPTGDLGRIDDGRVVLTGRRKDMIIRGDRNIYPGLYEAAVGALPGVAEALLVGVRTASGDERVVLAVAGDDTAGPTVRRAAPRLFGVDAPDEVVVLDALPRGGRSRKPDRDALRRMLADR